MFFLVMLKYQVRFFVEKEIFTLISMGAQKNELDCAIINDCHVIKCIQLQPLV